MTPPPATSPAHSRNRARNLRRHEFCGATRNSVDRNIEKSENGLLVARPPNRNRDVFRQLHCLCSEEDKAMLQESFASDEVYIPY